MITPIVKENQVIFGPCRLSFTHLFKRFVGQGDTSDGKYMTNVLIPKGETETVKAIRQAIETAKKMAVQNKWKSEPKKLDMPLRDGEEKDHDNDGIYPGNYYVNAKSSTRPGVVDKDRNPIMDEDEIYSGCWAVVSITFYGYDVSGNKGIACGLNNVMKVRDGDRLGGRKSAEADFADVQLDDTYADDDDL